MAAPKSLVSTPFTIAAALLLTSLLPPPLHAQSSRPVAPPTPAQEFPTQVPSAPPSQPGFTITTRSTLVLVPALVKTKSGAVVYTLKADDFTLTDNGVPQKLTLEEDTGDQPLALVVLIETGGAGGRELPLYRSLPTMLDSVVGGEPHKIAVVTFDSGPHFVQKFTPNMDRVANTLNNIGPGDDKAATLDAIAFATNLLRRRPPQFRRAILLISETLDQGSHTNLGEVLRLIGDTNTVIYSVAFSSTTSAAKHESSKIIQSDTPGPPGGCMAKDPNADPNITENEFAKAFECLQILIPPIRVAKIAALAGIHGLQKDVPKTVAQLTGGEFFKFSNTKSLEKDLQTISNHVPNRYVLSFHPQSPQPGIHALDLQLKDYPNLKVTARASYWADEDTSTPIGK
jgi:VWFA-related protein